MQTTLSKFATIFLWTFCVVRASGQNPKPDPTSVGAQRGPASEITDTKFDAIEKRLNEVARDLDRLSASEDRAFPVIYYFLVAVSVVVTVGTLVASGATVYFSRRAQDEAKDYFDRTSTLNEKTMEYYKNVLTEHFGEIQNKFGRMEERFSVFAQTMKPADEIYANVRAEIEKALGPYERSDEMRQKVLADLRALLSADPTALADFKKLFERSEFTDLIRRALVGGDQTAPSPEKS